MKKIEKYIVLICLIAVAGLCSLAWADQIVIGTSAGGIFVRDEADLSSGQSAETFFENAIRPVTAVTANTDTGDIVIGMAGFGHGFIVSCNALNINNSISNAVAFAQNASSLTIDINGNLIAGGNDGIQPVVMQRMIPHVDSFPPNPPYVYPNAVMGAPSYTAIVTADSRGKFYVAVKETGLIIYRTLTWDRPVAYPMDQTSAGGQVNAMGTTSRGYIVYGMNNGTVHIRGNSSNWMGAAPAGYIETTGSLGSPVTALFVTSDNPGKVVIGLANGKVSVRGASTLTTVISSIDFGVGHGISALTSTSNGNVAIATDDGGWVHVRSLSNLNTIVTSPVQFGGTVTGLAVCPLLLPANCNEAIENGLDMVSDLNSDCKVDFEDFEVFVQNWLHCMNPQDVNCL
ncbi:MAG: hypothetical protein ACYC54_11445 [Sedimentisphaerales bacterium]